MGKSLQKFLLNPLVVSIFLVVAISCALVYGTLAWLGQYTQHGKAVAVPDVKGLKIEKAETFFERAGLRYHVVDSVFSKKVQPGAIVELKPEVGAKVKEGRIIYVTINALTVQMARLPEVEDLSMRQALAQLASRGFTDITIEFVPGNFKDLVVSIERDGKYIDTTKPIPLSTPLTLIVSNGLDRLTVEDSLRMGLIDSIPQFAALEVQDIDNTDESWF